MFGRDPFANDPFFSNNGFGNMGSMIGKMHKQMERAMQEPMK